MLIHYMYVLFSIWHIHEAPILTGLCDDMLTQNVLLFQVSYVLSHLETLCILLLLTRNSKMYQIQRLITESHVCVYHLC
jgi:hypothetical protein